MKKLLWSIPLFLTVVVLAQIRPGDSGGVNGGFGVFTGPAYFWPSSNPRPVDHGSWLIDEEFMGDTTTRSLGVNAWTTVLTGGGVLELNTNFPGVFAVKGMVVTNASSSDRSGMALTSIINGTTNMELYCIMRAAVGTPNFTDATNEFHIGLSDNTTSEAGNGIYYKCVSNTWYACSARAGTRTCHQLLSNAVDSTFTVLAWHLETNQTNVNFYMGGTPETMTFQTNINARVPNTPGIQLNAIVMSRKQSGITERMTNYVDYFKLWGRRL